MSIPAYPLTWPEGWPRTASDQRARARFSKRGRSGYGNWQVNRELSIAQAVERARAELQRMGVDDDDLVISTDLKLRLDGLPRSSQREPDDPGAAVYWIDAGGETRCMAIDRYDRIADNIAAIAATLDAMRAIERHGGAEILNRAFRGFTALEHDRADAWHDVLDVPAHADENDVEQAYRRLRSKHHPDRGGEADRFQQIQKAFEQAIRDLNA